MQKLIALVLLFALPAYAVDGGTQVPPSEAIDVKRATIVEKHTETWHVVEGGCWLSETVCIESAKARVTETEVAKKHEEAAVSPPTSLIVIVGVAVLSAFALGFKLGRDAGKKAEK